MKGENIMKELGRMNVTKEMLDEIFDKEHIGTSVKDVIGAKLTVTGFALYDVEGKYHLKFFAESGQGNHEDFFTSSQVFIKDFLRTAKQFEDGEPFDIIVAQGESKKGRKYLYIENAPTTKSNNTDWRNIV